MATVSMRENLLMGLERRLTGRIFNR